MKRSPGLPLEPRSVGAVDVREAANGPLLRDHAGTTGPLLNTFQLR